MSSETAMHERKDAPPAVTPEQRRQTIEARRAQERAAAEAYRAKRAEQAAADGIKIEFTPADAEQIRVREERRRKELEAAEQEKYGKVLTEAERAEVEAHGHLLTDEEKAEMAKAAEEEKKAEEAKMAEEAKLAAARAEERAKAEQEAAAKEAARQKSLQDPVTRLEWLKAAEILPADTPDSSE